MDRYSKLGKNVLLITLGNFASKILSFFMLPLYTAVLTTAEYGTADLMTTTINLLSPFFTLLISEAIIRFALDEKKSQKQVFTIGLIITITGFLLMMIFSPLMLFNQEISKYYIYFILYYFFSTLHSLLSQFVKGIEKVGVYSFSGVFQTFCFIILNLIFLLGFKIGVIGYLLSLILSNAFTCVVLWVGARLNKYIVKISVIDKKLFKEMLAYSVPLIPNSLSWWVSNSSDKYLLTFFYGVSVTGVYSVAQRIPSLFSIISTIFIGAWQISAVEDFGSTSSKRFYSNIYQMYSSLNILIISFLICGCKFFAKFLFSKEFFEGWKYVPVLLIAFLFFAMSGFLGSIYTSAKKTKMVFVSTIIAAITNIVLNFYLIPKCGVQGAAIATLISYFLIWLIRLIDTRKIIKLDINLKKDVISYIIILMQMFFILIDKINTFICAIMLFIILIFVNKGFMKDIFFTGMRIIKKKDSD